MSSPQVPPGVDDVLERVGSVHKGQALLRAIDFEDARYFQVGSSRSPYTGGGVSYYPFVNSP